MCTPCSAIPSCILSETFSSFRVFTGIPYGDMCRLSKEDIKVSGTKKLCLFEEGTNMATAGKPTAENARRSFSTATGGSSPRPTRARSGGGAVAGQIPFHTAEEFAPANLARVGRAGRMKAQRKRPIRQEQSRNMLESNREGIPGGGYTKARVWHFFYGRQTPSPRRNSRGLAQRGARWLRLTPFPCPLKKRRAGLSKNDYSTVYST